MNPVLQAASASKRSSTYSTHGDCLGQEMVMSLLKECPRDPERFMLRSRPERCLGVCTVLPLAFLLHVSVAWCIAVTRWLLEQDWACTFRIRAMQTATQYSYSASPKFFAPNLPSKNTCLCFFEKVFFVYQLHLGARHYQFRVALAYRHRPAPRTMLQSTTIFSTSLTISA